jgi:hypothetical protein
VHPNDLTPSTDPDPKYPTHSPLQIHTPGPTGRGRGDVSNVATPGTGGGSGSGANTPSSAGFVSLASLKLVNGRLRRQDSGSGGRKQTSEVGSGSIQRKEEEKGVECQVAGEQDDDPEERAEYLRWDGKVGLDDEKYAVLPNDWPYNTPYGVRHYCVWSRVSFPFSDGDRGLAIRQGLETGYGKGFKRDMMACDAGIAPVSHFCLNRLPRLLLSRPLSPSSSFLGSPTVPDSHRVPSWYTHTPGSPANIVRSP